MNEIGFHAKEEIKIMKKILKATVSLCLIGTLAATVTGCGNHNNSENDGKNTIRIFTYSGQEFESVTMDSVMKKIEDTVGVKLSFEGRRGGRLLYQAHPDDELSGLA